MTVRIFSWQNLRVFANRNLTYCIRVICYVICGKSVSISG
jgi:hypothetical protein